MRRERDGQRYSRGARETGLRTGRVAQDPIGPGASRESAGSGAAGRRVDRHGSPSDRDPLPTRIDGLPLVPDAFRVALAAGLPAIPAGLTPDAGDRIDAHVRLLLAWNRAINLT